MALESGGSLVASEGIGNVGKDDLDPNWVGLGDLSLYLILRFSNLAISTSENGKKNNSPVTIQKKHAKKHALKQSKVRWPGYFTMLFSLLYSTSIE